MTRTLSLAALLALSLDHGHCQGAAKPAAFEVASIAPSKPGTPAPPMEHAGVVQFTYPGGRFKATATTVKFLIEWAYGIEPEQHTGGPAWLETDRYDIEAKAAGEATDAEMKRMMQALLAERFKLRLHHESKDLSVYVITPGKSAPKLSPAKEGEAHSLGASPVTGSDPKLPGYRVVATRFSIDQLSDAFSRTLDHLVVNKTGLDGEYDFTLELSPDETRPNPMDPSLLISALHEQLGLTLQTQKIPVDLLVIESAERVSAGN